MSINGKSILVIDDDAGMLRALNKVLSGEGAVVTSAGYAGEAMEHLTGWSERFDVIITDLRMPIVGGQAILSAVAVAFPQVPVIVITAFGNPEVKAQCMQQGAAAFLEKPLDTPQLLQAIESAFAPREPESSRGARHRRAVRKRKLSGSQSDTEPSDGLKTGLVHGTGFLEY